MNAKRKPSNPRTRTGLRLDWETRRQLGHRSSSVPRDYCGR